ncbi:2034_t:CDS:2, partial [Diversispora eburnea]
CVQRYFQLIDFNISTEEQIVNLIQSEENEESESDSDDDKVLPVSVKDAISGVIEFNSKKQKSLDTFIDI